MNCNWSQYVFRFSYRDTNPFRQIFGVSSLVVVHQDSGGYDNVAVLCVCELFLPMP